jgi:hypothetical protein
MKSCAYDIFLMYNFLIYDLEHVIIPVLTHKHTFFLYLFLLLFFLYIDFSHCLSSKLIIYDQILILIDSNFIFLSGFQP